MYWTYANLNQEVSQVLFELWDVLVEAEQSLNEHFDLCTAHINHADAQLTPYQQQPQNTVQRGTVRNKTGSINVTLQ